MVLNTRQAAQKLGVSVTRVQAMIKQGLIKATKFGRDWMIEESVLESPRVKNRRPGRPRKRSK